MTQTSKLQLPYILTAQAQKEVTHNDALNLLDIFTRPTVLERDKNTPPVSPTAGDCYVVGDTPTDAFIDHAQAIACYTVNGWVFAPAFKWLDVVNAADQMRYVFDGSAWVPFGLIIQDSGEYLRVERLGEAVALTGASTDTTIQIPNRATVLAVNARVTTAVMGVTSFDIGVSGDTARYGDDIAITLDTTNIGITQHPQGYYADTSITLTANGGSFSGGVVELSIQYLLTRGAWSW
ncbi:MAG: DUF2793 domain-containing protein [Rickettsiales bacterium]|nr:DUF2793 domain-containing protein [Rickettsiales bacterium]